MNIGFTGHRNRIADPDSIRKILKNYPGCTVIHGGALGFDAQADEISREMGNACVVIRPDYKTFHPKRAPLERNKTIIERSDLIVACYDGRKTGGTYQAISYAKKLGKRVVLLPIEK